MNKKIIAIAIATAMAAPVAMADVKMSGRVNQQLTNEDRDSTPSVTSRAVNDSGQGRLVFDATAGDAYARMGLDLKKTAGTLAARDQYVGYKFGAGSLQMGRMGWAGKNVEKDALIGTFLQTRDTAASAAPSASKIFASNGFVDQVAQFKTKAGSATINVQLGLADSGTTTGSKNQGYTGIAITGKASGVKYWVSHNNDKGDEGATGNDDSNTKLGATMKFGKIAATLNYETHDNNGVSNEAITIRANMGLGNGLKAYAGLAMASGDAGAADDATWLRLAISKKLNKNATAYVGYTSTDNDAANADPDTSTIGAGMTVKF